MAECQLLDSPNLQRRHGERVGELQECNRQSVPGYPTGSAFVSENGGKVKPLPCPVGAKLTVGPVEDTEYNDSPEVVNAWGKFYLPKTTKMEVIGYVEGTSYPCDQLVLMTSEDQKVYGFDGDELHLVASSPREVLEKGVNYPALQSYYYGEPFEDMTTEDWAEVDQGPLGKKLEEEHRRLVASHKSAFLKNLKNISQSSVSV